MKTVKQMLLTIAVLLCSAAVSAQDFEIDGIFYNILDETEKTAEVTFKGSTGDAYENEYTGSVVIPESVTYSDVTYSVTTIGEWAFSGCSGLTSITIPNSVTTIREYAFSSCSGLTSITIPNSVTTIGYNAFSSCSSLTSVTIPNSVTTIGYNVFNSCSGLASIVVEEGNSHYDSRDNCNAIIETSTNTLITGCKNTVIPNSVTTIGMHAFSGCSGLASITIPNSVTIIGRGAFYGCSGLTSITIPNSVTTIEYSTFSSCSGLASIVVEEGNSHYDSRDNCNAIIETSTNTLIAGCKNTVIPNGVTTIEDFAFSGCSGLASISIPNSVTTIGIWAFYGCSGLTSITIPNGVTTIGESAFLDCSGLTSVTIPNSVTTIGESAFMGCSGLTSIYVESVTPATIFGGNTFYGVTDNATLYVPIGAKAAYEAAEYWSEFTNIVAREAINAYELNVSSVRYASMYLDYPVAIPEGVKVYTADRVEGDLLKMEEVTGVIPANTGVIVRAAEGTYNFASVQPINIADNADEMLYSNAYCTVTSWGDQFEGWDVLFDGNTSTIFHSDYGTANTTDGLDHYLRVDMGEGNEISKFAFTFTTRSKNCDVNSPTTIVVEGSNVADGEYTEIATLTGLPTTNSTVYESEILGNGNAYRYIRYRVTATQSMQNAAGHVFFFISEFGMSKAVEPTAEAIEIASTNLLKGTVTDTYIAPASNEKHYVLSVVDDVVGMYCPKLNSEGKFLNNANKAYMVITGLNVDGDDDLDTGNPGTQLSNGYRFDFSGTTAIEEVVTESTTIAPVYYDLSGRRVENPTKGIYILNGKKVLVK